MKKFVIFIIAILIFVSACSSAPIIVEQNSGTLTATITSAFQTSESSQTGKSTQTTTPITTSKSAQTTTPITTSKFAQTTELITTSKSTQTPEPIQPPFEPPLLNLISFDSINEMLDGLSSGSVRGRSINEEISYIEKNERNKGRFRKLLALRQIEWVNGDSGNLSPAVRR